jgi:octaprenyl-diphosphate synthase
MERRGAIGITLDRARGFAADAKEALSVFPASPLRQQLQAVADFTVSRVS